MRKKIITALIALLTLSAMLLTGCGSNEESTAAKPTFKYFIANSDADTEKTLAVVDELKGEYGEKVNFELINIDEDAEAAQNFAIVVGETPALIMLDSYNNITAIQLQCADKDMLEREINDAMY